MKAITPRLLVLGTAAVLCGMAACPWTPRAAAAEPGTPDAVDPAQRRHRHPLDEGFVQPRDPVLPTEDPAFAPLRHDRYTLAIRRDAAMRQAVVEVGLPAAVLRLDEPALRAVACRVMRFMLSAPHFATLAAVRVHLVGGPAYDLTPGACPGNASP